MWGFPLGVTQTELRAAAGEPDSVRDTTTTRPMIPGLAQTDPPKTQSWQYRRNGTTFLIGFSNNLATFIEVLPTFSTTLDQTSSTAPPSDPMGLHIGDTLGQLLIKSGAVTSINPKSNVSVMTAMLNVTHDGLVYNFMISNGRIQSETIHLLQQP
ncbi:MAG TPA: hypothetical protein VK702_12535 [Candidatus Acidoferrum sp.]|nr:hypothetical protein [Candidatus Acidoferrum sp.]